MYIRHLYIFNTDYLHNIKIGIKFVASFNSDTINGFNFGDNIPLIDIEHCNYYSYRHSFVMAEIQKPNCNFLALAQMIGKSSRTLYQYISELTNDEDLV